MPSGNMYEANILENSSDLCSFLDFLPTFEDTESGYTTMYSDVIYEEANSDKRDLTALNGDDKFLDSIIKGLLESSENSGLLENTFNEEANFGGTDLSYVLDPNIEDSEISVLGVNLDLCSTNNNYLLDNNFNEILNDSDLDLEFSSNVNDIFINTPCDYNFVNDNNINNVESTTQPTELLNMFPHINDEKNRRRRSLLYESTSRVKSKENHFMDTYENHPHRKNDALLNHDYTQNKNNEEKYFTCPIVNCEKVYAKASHLKAHLRRHSGEKPFACNWINCTWKFSRSDELARHKRSHSGVKPYKCDMCEKAFARSDHLSKHRKVHKKKMAQCGSYFIKKRTRYNC